MVLASLADVLAVVDGPAGFLIGLFVGWWLWHRRPPDRRYQVDLTVRKPPPEG